jgi:NAD+ kinase
LTAARSLRGSRPACGKASNVKRLGLLYHPKIAAARELTEKLVDRISRDDVTTWVESSWDVVAMRRHMADSDFVITLGGDGTIIRTARLAAPCQVPILGINFGRLGFLAEIQPEHALTQVPQVLTDDVWIEKRELLRTHVVRNGETVEEHEAVNDVFAGRGETPRAVRIRLRVDGAEMRTYTADGVVVATPTGSTAYALGAGGPVLAPELAAMLITPIVPHPVPYPSLVIGNQSKVDVMVDTYRDAVMAIDGQIMRPLHRGDCVSISRSENRALFIRLHPPSNFYATLYEKLHRSGGPDE